MTKVKKISTTDPESGYMVRDGKPKGFFYLEHRTVDGKFNIITDTYVTAANIHDSIPYLKRLDHQRNKFNFKVKSVGLDAGYFTPHICKGLESRDIFSSISYRRSNHLKGYFYKREYMFDKKEDIYTCPAGEQLKYQTTDRNGYRKYVSNPAVCKKCPFLAKYAN